VSDQKHNFIIFGQDQTAIDKQANKLKNCIAEYTTAQDLVNICPKLSRNAIVNDVPANPNRVIGLETARDVFHIEHGQDFCSEQNITDCASDYNAANFSLGLRNLRGSTQHL
jgi:hypothetical protein